MSRAELHQRKEATIGLRNPAVCWFRRRRRFLSEHVLGLLGNASSPARKRSGWMLSIQLCECLHNEVTGYILFQHQLFMFRVNWYSKPR